jgi:hypothetical protein
MKNRLFAIIFLFAGFVMQAQEKKTVIHVERANEITYSRSIGKEAQRLLGNVVLRHDSTYFYCDSAYLYEKTKSFDAFSNVHILVNDSVEIYSDLMFYDGNKKYAEFFDNVRLKDDSTLLKTEYLTYSRTQHLATYPDSAVTTRGDKKLVSKVGFYRDDIKELSFFDEVEVTSPKYQMYTDTLFYNTNIEKMWFYGPTKIINEDNILEGEYGYYLSNEEHAFINKRPLLYNETQRVKSDSIFYDRTRGFAQIMNSIDMIDTAYKVILRGEYVELWEKLGKSFATDSAQAIYYYEKGDSLFMHADTLYFYFKTELNDEEKVLAYNNVRFFKSDMQGKCDSMAYQMSDSTIKMRVRPVLWTDNSQMTADSINITIANQKIDSVLQDDNAFIISRDSVEGYNQIKGTDIASRFRDGNINNVNVRGNAQTIYWLREDDTSLIGINVSKSNSMLITMDKNSISRIKYFSNIDETMYPEAELKENERYLEGFIWHENLRPKDKADIFRKDVEEETAHDKQNDKQSSAIETQKHRRIHKKGE